MANYNTFVIVECKRGKVELVTSSAFKSFKSLAKGKRIEIWNENQRVATIYNHQPLRMNDYMEAEREYHRYKQEKAEYYNARRGILRDTK